MATKPQKIGILAVHGMGEQTRLRHLRGTAGELRTAIQQLLGDAKVDEIDQTPAKIPCIVLRATVEDPEGGQERVVEIHVREVFWADLGASGPILSQFRFWLWGLGQWAAHVVFEGRKLGNTTQLMVMPRFGFQTSPDDPPGFWHRLPTRALLLAASLLAFIVGFTWTALKEVMFRAFKAFPKSTLIYRFLGDVMIYERGYNGPTEKDAHLPRRATIRRRMVRGITQMASSDFDRWYIFAHSLGAVPAFNALQETEIALPNYLCQEEWLTLPEALKTNSPFLPQGKTATTRRMMPKRPKWLTDTDGISRKQLFAGLAGFVTYGCPLDKFAALWPRIVCLNRQTQVFQPGCEWVNFHDPTDPVSARLDAFGPPPRDEAEEPTDRIALEPVNIACRASPWFLLSHIRYFTPRGQQSPRTVGGIAAALLSNTGLSIAEAAAAAAIGKGASRLRLGFASVTAMLIACALLAIGAVIALYVGDYAGLQWPYCSYVYLILGAAGIAIMGAGLLRTVADYTTRDKL